MSSQQINQVLAFWFAERERTELVVDSRMDCWFGDNEQFDLELGRQFSARVEEALKGDLDHWAGQKDGRLALILLLGQFPRHIYKGTREAFAGDRQALKFCEAGVADESYRNMSALQQMFFFMPLQRMESLKVQDTSVKIYWALTKGVSDTLRDSFETVAQFAELRRDVIEQFGRFPHRNAPLGRTNTGNEENYLTAQTCAAPV